MRKVWIVVASGLLAFANFVKSQETGRTLYSSRYDNLDIDTILSSNRLVNNYVDCLLSRKPCPPEGKDLKRILPEALRTKCGRCSSTQKENALKIITTLYNSYPDQYQALRERWDPSGEYHRRFEEYIRGLQFNQIGGNSNGPSERPVRNDFDRDQSQILLQTLILSTTAETPSAAPPSSVGVPEQRPPQLASAQLTQPFRPFNNFIQFRPCFTRCSSRFRPSWSQRPKPQKQYHHQQQFHFFNPDSFFGFKIDTDTDTRTESEVEVLYSEVDDLNTAATTRSPSTDSPFFSRLVLRPVDGLSFETTTSTVDLQPTVGPLSNRFGDDDSSGGAMTTVRPITTSTTQRPVRQTTTGRPVTQRTTSRFVEPVPVFQLVQGQFQVVAQQPPQPQPQPSPSQNFQQQQPQPGPGVVVQQPIVPNNVIDNFFIPPGQQPQNQGPASPIVGLFSQIGNKLATTADAIAGMLRKTVDVIVTSHIQSHQRALRSFANQQ